jgi:hypothetical protein
MTFTFSKQADGSHTCIARDGDLTARLAPNGTHDPLCLPEWTWEVRTFGEVVDSGWHHGLVNARAQARLVLDLLDPIFAD